MDGSLGYAPVQADATQVKTSNRVVILGALSAIATAAARPSTAHSTSAATVFGRVSPITTTRPVCAARNAARSR